MAWGKKALNYPLAVLGFKFAPNLSTTNPDMCTHAHTHEHTMVFYSQTSFSSLLALPWSHLLMLLGPRFSRFPLRLIHSLLPSAFSSSFLQSLSDLCPCFSIFSLLCIIHVPWFASHWSSTLRPPKSNLQPILPILHVQISLHLTV